MTTERTCPKCSAPLPPDAPDGLCPRCLMQAGLAGEPDETTDGLGEDPAPTPPKPEATGGTAEIETPLPQAEGAGTVIGRFKLLQQIGEGGFGTVYLAEQREPFVKKVALKIIKLGMDTKQVVARFEAERQALALMDHPNIARVLDGGSTASGRPYFVMDYVKGVSITRFCDEFQLDTEQRLRLFETRTIRLLVPQHQLVAEIE